MGCFGETRSRNTALILSFWEFAGEMNMKALRISILCFVVLLLAAPLLGAQDLSKYRNFSLGMSLAELSKQVDLKPLQAKLIHKHPALIQELAWWPKETSGPL